MPMTKGSMDDIGGDVDPSQADGSEPMDTGASSQGTRAIYDREARITIDYRKLNEDYRDVSILYLFTRVIQVTAAHEVAIRCSILPGR